MLRVKWKRLSTVAMLGMYSQMWNDLEPPPYPNQPSGYRFKSHGRALPKAAALLCLREALLGFKRFPRGPLVYCS